NAQARFRAYLAMEARTPAGGLARSSGPVTMADALAAYFAHYVRRGGKALGHMQSTARTYILPALGEPLVTKLTRRQLEQWHDAIARSAPRVRSRPGGAQRFRAHQLDAEGLRRRRATANRALTI